jgi:uncharacterized protein (TIGR03000 family)
MYSMVLMAALTAGEGSANWHGWSLGHNYGACYGACYGVGYHGWGGWGHPYGGYGWPGYACWGGCGGYASAAYGVPMTPLVVPPPYVPAPEKDKDKDKEPDDEKKMDKDKDKDKEKGKKKGKPPEPDDTTSASIIFVLPQGASLHVDDRPVDAKVGVQTFKTPQLEKGQRYFYDVRVEVVRDGKPVSATRRLVLQAGSVIRADFSNIASGTGVAAAAE